MFRESQFGIIHTETLMLKFEIENSQRNRKKTKNPIDQMVTILIFMTRNTHKNELPPHDKLNATCEHQNLPETKISNASAIE